MGFSVSFTQVLALREIKIILLGGAFKHVADFYQFSLVGATSVLIKNPEYSFAPFFFGQLVGAVLAGVTNDIWFSECQFLLMAIINLLTVLGNLWDIVYPRYDYEYIAWTLALFGASTGFSNMFTMVLLPMTAADKNRMLAYELTMLGTIIALVNLTMYFTTFLLGGFVNALIKQDVSFGNILNRSIVILLIIVSTWIIWKTARAELSKITRRMRSRSSVSSDQNSSSNLQTLSEESNTSRCCSCF